MKRQNRDQRLTGDACYDDLVTAMSHILRWAWTQTTVSLRVLDTRVDGILARIRVLGLPQIITECKENALGTHLCPSLDKRVPDSRAAPGPAGTGPGTGSMVLRRARVRARSGSEGLGPVL